MKSRLAALKVVELEAALELLRLPGRGAKETKQVSLWSVKFTFVKLSGATLPHTILHI